MVQRKVQSKVSIQADHVKSEKLFSSSQDVKNLMKKRMKKPKSIKLPDFDEALGSSSSSSQSPPSSRRCYPHVPTTSSAATASPQKKQHPLARGLDSWPNYMKPTSSSDAKKELFSGSLRNTHQSVSNTKKNLARKSLSDSKANSVSNSKKLSLMRSLTKTTSFKASRANCPRKSTRATCSSTLKDSKFPAYLMLNPGGTESEGTSVVNVCPYTYCSLNGHHHRHSTLPPLKTFVAARRQFLKIQKSARVENLSSRRSNKKKEEEDSEIEQSNAKATFDGNGTDMFIEIYAKGREGIADTLKYEIEIDDVAIVIDPKEKLIQEEKTEETEEAEEISMGSYCGDDSCDDAENMKNSEEMDDDYDNGSKATEMEWEEQRRICGIGREAEDVDSSVFTEDTDTDSDSKQESLSEISRDSSVIWYDDIISSYYEGILAEESKLSEELVDEVTIDDCEGQKMSETFRDVGGEDRPLMEDEKQDQEKELLQGRANKNSQNTSCNAITNKKFAITRKSRIDDDDEEMSKFNPKEPNFLPVVPEPEAEKVDLRHQMMDERKDAEEWMLDCALRQAVTKLAPGRKKKVALLVEAFETVMPAMHKCETHYHVRRTNDSAFPNARRIQACI